MTLWLAAAVLTAGVVSLLLWRRPATGSVEDGAHDLAIYRDQLAEIDRDAERGLIDAPQADAARTEISRRMLSAADRGEVAVGVHRRGGSWLKITLVVALPLAALALYLPTGRPDLPSQPFVSRDQPGQQTMMAAIRDVDALERTLIDNPDNAPGWIELGQRNRELGRINEAVSAFARAIGLTGGDPMVTGLYAESLVQLAEGIVTEDAIHAFEAVLERLPGEPRAQYYLGLARSQAGDDVGAMERWQRLAANSPANAPWLPTVHEQIRRTADRLDLDPESQVPTPLSAGAQAAAGPRGPNAADIAAAQSMSAEDQAAMIRGMVEGLASRLEDTPEDLAGWQRLGAAYRVLGEPEKAVDALSRASALAPDDPEILGAYADALLDTTSGQSMAPEFITVMERLLEIDPNDVRALWFLGAKALADERPQQAEQHWRRLLAQLEPGTDAYLTVNEFLDGLEPKAP